MADTYVGVNDASAATKLLRMFQVLVGANQVLSEGVVACDPTDAAAAAAVKNAGPGASDYGSVVRPIGLVGSIDAPATWQAVPTVEAALIAATVRVLGIHIVNTTGAAVTFTLKDNQGSPLTILSAFSIPALSILDLPWHGTIFTGGLRWLAGGAGLVGAVEAYQ